MTSSDPIQLLIDDHATVRKMLNDFESLPKGDFNSKFELAKTLVKNLQFHEQMEEEVFYPFFKSASTSQEGNDLVEHSFCEHRKVDIIILDMLQADREEELDTKMKTMSQNLLHHVEEEETKMFPMARTLLGDRAQELLDSMLAVKRRMEAETPAPVPTSVLESRIEEKLPEEGGDSEKKIEAQEETPTSATTTTEEMAAPISSIEPTTASEDGEKPKETQEETPTSGTEPITGKKHEITTESASKQPRAKRTKQR